MKINKKFVGVRLKPSTIDKLEKLSKEERISINQYVVFLSYTCNYIEILSVLLTLIFEFEHKNSH